MPFAGCSSPFSAGPPQVQVLDVAYPSASRTRTLTDKLLAPASVTVHPATLTVAVRRQARVLTDQVILPDGIESGVWYDVCPGRRRDDNRPGVVLLDLGTSRMLMPESCLEFRQVATGHTTGQSGSKADSQAVTRVRSKTVAMRASQAVAVLHGRMPANLRRNVVGLAASLVPLGLAAIYTLHRSSQLR